MSLEPLGCTRLFHEEKKMARTPNHLLLVTLAVLLASSLCLGQSANAAQNQAPASMSSSSQSPPAESAKGHGVMPVELTKSLDSKKLKEGDVVTGKIAADLRLKDGTTIPLGSKVTGHVTEARARSKGDPQSALGIVFDKITLPGGKALAIKGEIQAVAPNPNAGSAESTSGSIGPGMMAGHEGASAGTTPPPMPSSPTSRQSGRPLLNAQSKGVVGFHNLELGDNSVLISTGKNVSLDSGTQMMLQVEIE
jgi:hypothetical protein